MTEVVSQIGEPPRGQISSYQLGIFAGLSLGVPLHRIPVERMGYITLAGFDLDKSGHYRITVHVLRPVPGGEQAAGGRAAVELVRATGATIDAAMHAVTSGVPRHLFWGHLRVVVVGESLARQGLGPILDFLHRVPEVRPTALLFVARDEEDNCEGAVLKQR